MPDIEKKGGKELRIVGFLCNWCSYGGADTAGVSRFKQPTDLRIVRVPCSGRVDPLFVVKALLTAPTASSSQAAIPATATTRTVIFMRGEGSKC